LGSPQEQLFTHANASRELLWQFRLAFSFQYSAGVGLLGPVITSYTLIAHLRRQVDIPPLFTRAVQAIREHGHLEIVPFLLAGLKALERSYSTQMPLEVQGYMRVLEWLRPDLTNVPMEMPVIVHHVDSFDKEMLSPHTPRQESMGNLLTWYSETMIEQQSSLLEHGRSQ